MKRRGKYEDKSDEVSALFAGAAVFVLFGVAFYRDVVRSRW